MKKLTLTIAIVLGLCMTTFAESNNHQGGLFMRGAEPREYGTRDDIDVPMLPTHNQDANQGAPLGTGIAIMTALGAAYLVGKRRKEE